MTNTILVPIDFSVESLNTLKIALEQHKHDKVNVVLMYAENQNDSITELLFYSAEKTIQSLLNTTFNDALTILKNSYESSIQSFKIKIFHGQHANAFANFAEVNKIDLVYIPKSYRLQLKKRGFDPLPLIKKSKIQFKEVAWSFGNKSSNDHELNQLFI